MANVTAIIHIDESTKSLKNINGLDVVKVKFWTTEPYDITIGDYIYWQGKQYFVNTLPDVKKVATTRFEYTATFERRHYDLAKVQFRNE